MSGHTPGPWRWDTDFNGLYNMDMPETVLDFEPWEGMRLEYHVDQDRREANARLIAAAPDLLEALENLLWHAEQLEEFQESERGKGQTIEQMYAAGEMHAYMVDAKIAIARAKGEK